MGDKLPCLGHMTTLPPGGNVAPEAMEKRWLSYPKSNFLVKPMN